MTFGIRYHFCLVSPLKAGLFLLFLHALLGCTSHQHPIEFVAPQISPPKSEFILMRDFHTTWNALARALDGSEERSVQRQNSLTGKVTLLPAPVVLEANCDCGRLGDVPLTGEGQRHTLIRLQKRAPQETLLKISCDYSTTYHWKDIHGQAVRAETIPCVSNGRFERQLYQRVLGFMSP